MVKDEWEIGQLRDAIAATHVGFEAVIADLPGACSGAAASAGSKGSSGCMRGIPGNGVGYDSICAAGDHANTLHWIKNTGDIRLGDLVLLDAGVEVDSLYTADITRTLPVSGTFTDAQREIYDAVYAAQQAGLAAVRPGQQVLRHPRCRDPRHRRAPACLGPAAEGVSVEDTLDPEHGQYHRRWMVHGTSITWASTCTTAPWPPARSTTTPPWPGMVLTVEPGFYFKADDLSSPRALPRHRRAHRGRRPRHRDRLREPVCRHAAHRRRRGGVDSRGPVALTSYLVATTCWIEVKSRCPPVIA
jgi:Xaa-Pro aminopeptidase